MTRCLTEMGKVELIIQASLPVSGGGFMTRRCLPSQILSPQDSQWSLHSQFVSWLTLDFPNELHSLLCSSVRTGWHFTKYWIFFVSHRTYLKGFISNSDSVYSCQAFISLDVPESLNLCDLMVCSPPGSSVDEIL